MLNDGDVNVDTVEVDPVFGTTGSFLTVTLALGSSSGGGGAVDSVNGEVGTVVLDATDVGADAAGAAATAQAAAEATAAGALSTHAADTTSIHGIADTSALVLTGDSRLADARTPTAHATSHQDGGADELALDGSQITAGTVADARIASTIARDSEVAAGYQPLDADLTTVAALDSATAGALVTDGSGWIRKTYAQLKTALSLVKADVGLGSVDNTADTAKPVSTAQQTALDLKANLASPALTGTPTAPTQSAGNNSTRLATTAYVDTASGLLVPKSLFDANTILAATTDDTPVALTVAASRIVGRKATGDIGSLTPAEALAVLSGGGTPDGTKFLRDDNTLAVPAGGSSTLGTLGYAQAVADQSTITTIADLTSLAATVTVASGRRIRITGFLASVITSVAATGFTLSIREGATQISQANFWLPSTAVGLSAIVQTVLTPSAGSHTYKLSLARATGTGVLGTQAAATYPAFILVEDIGT